MSEIPLHNIEKSNGSPAYRSLRNDDSESGSFANGSSKLMPTAVRTAAVVSSRSRDKGKQQERYKDEPHESQTLLSGHEHQEDEDEDLVVYSQETTIPSVCSSEYHLWILLNICFPYSELLTIGLAHHHLREKTNQEVSHFVLQVWISRTL